jgi:transcriptional regulator with XRE-family HTH domain
MLYYFCGNQWQPRMRRNLSTLPTPASDAALVTKAAIRTADKLRINNKTLAGIIGVSEATVSRMRNGRHALEAGSKSFELALLLVRLYRSLDALIGGDDVAAGAWLSNTNTALGETPIALIQSISGLMNVIQYLDARRAVV